MGIRFLCPNGHKLNVKAHLAGMRGICPHCAVRFLVPAKSGGRAEAISDEPAPARAQPEAAASPATATAVAPPPPPAISTPVPPAVGSEAEVWYVRTASGDQFGPAESDIMRAWVAEGRVTVDCHVWRTGWPEWKTGGQAITFLNGPLPDQIVSDAEVAPEKLPEANGDQVESQATSDRETPLPEESSPTAIYLANKRNRQERAKKITLLLSVVVVILFAVLVGVLMNNR